MIHRNQLITACQQGRSHRRVPPLALFFGDRIVPVHIAEVFGAEFAEPGNGRFTDVVLRPVVTITVDSDARKAESLHARAHAECFIANSVNFPVRCEPTIVNPEPA